jgi:hypothetical protein
VNLSLENMTVTASDYILQSLLRLKDKVLANMNPPVPQEPIKKKHTGSLSGSVVSKAIIEEVKEDNDLMAKMKELNVGEEDPRVSNRQSNRGSQMIKRMSQQVAGAQ